MTDRGLPIVDGAPACPFVAFEDDRDGRATAPDHRHRCFAEPRPAPRALAHQDAYCLSSSFPVCPTFQDWARREAAAARPPAGATRPAEPAEQDPLSRPMPPLDREGYRAPGTDSSTDAPKRHGQRDWAAPPPWVAGAAGAAGATTGAAEAGAAGAGSGGGLAGGGGAGTQDTPPEARGLAGSAADRLAGPDPADPLAPAPTRSPYAPPIPAYDAGHADDRDDDGDGDPDHDREAPDGRYAGAGLAGSAAAAAAGAAAWGDPGADLDEDGPDWAQDERYQLPPEGHQPAPQRQPVADDRRPPAPNSRSQVSKRQDPADLFGPAWEKPRRNEAYPTLSTRVGLPALGGIGRVGLGALGLLGAALALFFIGPMLLGIGSKDGGSGSNGSATDAPSAIVEATASPDPTPVPDPTPQVYVVKKGDTMSKIAKKFGLTVDQLLAANKQIKNPNKIAIGDEITIPLPDTVDDGSVDGASASP